MCLSPKWIKNNNDLGLWPNWQRFINVPCGKCDECRCSKAKEWGMRCVCELLTMTKQEQERSWFITLTYSDDFNDGNLHAEDMSKFIKKLRNTYRDLRIKYFYCGEFGSKTFRPHYHLILFNCPINDLKYWGKTKSNYSDFRSDFISKIWGKGIVSIGRLTLSSASYTARYSLKKNNTCCFQRMSQGIGKNYFLKFQKEIISNGCIGVPNSSGQIVYGRIPRYFIKIYRKLLGDDCKYSKFVKWYTKNVSNVAKSKLNCFQDIDDINYIDIKSVGLATRKELRQREASRLLKQALMDYYNVRDF